MATNTTRAALLASIVAIGMGCGGGASDPPATGSIAGSLLGAAVSGVEIDLASHAGVQATVTNSAGHYAFADLPAGSYVVWPSLSGFIATPSLATVDVVAGGGATANFVIATGSGGSGAAIVNGGFENGTLAGWTSTGFTSVSTTAHSGGFSVQVGLPVKTLPVNSVSQSFIAPTVSSTLSFWYWNICTDSVTYDWATANLTDNTASITTVVLPKICTFPGSWTQVTSGVIPGHHYTLTLIDFDDNCCTSGQDPTYTLYDDVTVF